MSATDNSVTINGWSVCHQLRRTTDKLPAPNAVVASMLTNGSNWEPREAAKRPELGPFGRKVSGRTSTGTPPRLPLLISAFFTLLRRVYGIQPIFSAIDTAVTHLVGRSRS